MKRLSGIHFASLRCGLALVWRTCGFWTLGLAAANLLQGLLPLASLRLTRGLVSETARQIATTPRFNEPALLARIAGFWVLVALLAYGCRLAVRLIQQLQTLRYSIAMSDRVNQQLIRLDLACFESPLLLNTIGLARAEAAARPLSMVAHLAGAGRGLLAAASIAGVLWTQLPGLAPALLLTVLPGLAVQVRISRLLNNWRRKHQAEERRAGYLGGLLANPMHAKDIRAYGLGDRFRRSHRTALEDLRGRQLTLTRRQLLLSVAGDAAGLSGLVLAALVIWPALRNGALSLGDLAMLWAAFAQARSTLNGLSQNVAGLYEDQLFLRHYLDFTALPVRIHDPPAPAILAPAQACALELRDVCFTYPDGSAPVLEGLSLRLDPGEHVALVGANGSGKTTLVKLLCRLYDPTAGAILLDGQDLRNLRLTDLRARMRILFQDFDHYFFTVADYIRQGLPDGADADADARMRVAAQRAGIAATIASLPRGYATPLGRWLDAGWEPSTGQWQRLALARAIVADTPLLILDEPASALDPGAERELVATMTRQWRARTLLTISHRATTVETMDRLIMLERGRIVADGAPRDLLASGGPYARLFHDAAARRAESDA